jgi:hypothetical protein
MFKTATRPASLVCNYDPLEKNYDCKFSYGYETEIKKTGGYKHFQKCSFDEIKEFINELGAIDTKDDDLHRWVIMDDKIARNINVLSFGNSTAIHINKI